MHDFLNTAGTSFEIIHSNSKGKITIAKSLDGSNDSFKHLCYGKYGEINIPKRNSYFSINTFIGSRKTENLFELKANFLDVDFKDLPDRTAEECREQFLFEYRKECYDIPKPTLIISSGHGVWALWLYKDTTICRKNGALNIAMLSAWNLTQKALYKKLTEYSVFPPDANALDCCRVMRPTGSINQKENMEPIEVKILEYNPGVLYTMNELLTYCTGVSREEYFIQRNAAKVVADTVKPKKKKTNNKGRSNNPDFLKTNIDRVHDMEKLVELRYPDGFYDGCGYREKYLFIYAYHMQILTRNIHKTLAKIKTLNTKFKNPLDDKELRKNVLNSVEEAVSKRSIIIATGPYAGKRMGYNYKTETLIEMFQITAEEQEQLKIICNKDIKYKRNLDSKKAKIRNNMGSTAKEQKKIDNIYKVHTYANQGLTQIEIADITGLSKGTVSKYLKEPCPHPSVVTISIKMQTKVS